MDEITRQIRAMYDRYPYPPRGAQDIEEKLSFFKEHQIHLPGTKDELQLLTGDEVHRNLRVLNAGCGTGGEHLLAPINEPENQFVFFDVTPASLDRVRDYVEHFSLNNVDVIEADIMELDKHLGEEFNNHFDYIVCTGVLHHLHVPEVGLRNLSKKLKHSGVMHLMLYGTYGRFEITLVQRVMDILEKDRSNLDQRVDTCANLLVSLMSSKHATRVAACNPTLKELAGRQRWSKEEIVDTFLHVNEKVYDVPAIYQLLDAADLRFLEFVDEPLWDLRLYNVYTEKLKGKLDSLSQFERYCLIELINGFKRMHGFYCAHEYSEFSRPGMDEIKNCVVYSKYRNNILEPEGNSIGCTGVFGLFPYDGIESTYMRCGIPLSAITREIVLQCKAGSSYTDLARCLVEKYHVDEAEVLRNIQELYDRKIVYLVRKGQG